MPKRKPSRRGKTQLERRVQREPSRVRVKRARKLPVTIVKKVGATKTLPQKEVMPRRKTLSLRQQTYLLEQRKKRAQDPKILRTFPAYTSDVRRTDSPCNRRAKRRAVLLAKGRVNKPGGAPGPYRRTPLSKDTCK